MLYDGFVGDLTETSEVVWNDVYARLKPGAHLIALMTPITYHRVACSIEDAGFEIRDQIAWIHDGDTSIQPAWLSCVMARKPLEGTVAETVLTYGTGALNIDACRIPTTDKLGGGAEKQTTADQKGNDGWTRPWMDDEHAREAHAERIRQNVARAEALGRFPANVIHDGSEIVETAFASFGEKGGGDKRGTCSGKRPAGFGNVGWDTGDGEPNARVYSDSGTIARFFFKARTKAELMTYFSRMIIPETGKLLAKGGIENPSIVVEPWQTNRS